MMKASVPLLKPDSKPVGYMDRSRLELRAAAFARRRISKSRPVDIAKAFVQPASQ